MPRITRARIAHAATLLVLTTSLFTAGRADEFTGTPGTDPKDFTLVGPVGATPPPAVATGSEVSFAPLPSWARGVLMPPLPQCLTPLGPRPAPLLAPKPAPPPPLAPPPDAKEMTTPTAASAPTPAAAPKPADTPAMITVSPFLQWVQSNPQAAAAQARQQAATYENQQNALLNSHEAAAAAAATHGASAPYWLPPLIDTPEINNGAPANSGPAPVTGSSAIYSTPQR